MIGRLYGLYSLYSSLYWVSCPTKPLLKLLVPGAGLLELTDALEVLFLVLEHLMVLLLCHTGFVPHAFNSADTSVAFGANDARDVLKVVEENVTFLLLSSCAEQL